jgi:hypothetical protein
MWRIGPTVPTELSLRVPNWAAKAPFGRSVSNADFRYLVSYSERALGRGAGRARLARAVRWQARGRWAVLLAPANRDRARHRAIGQGHGAPERPERGAVGNDLQFRDRDEAGLKASPAPKSNGPIIDAVVAAVVYLFERRDQRPRDRLPVMTMSTVRERFCTALAARMVETKTASGRRVTRR